MEEAVIAFGVFRLLLLREQGVELFGNAYGIEHLALCVARVDIAPLDAQVCAGGVEVLEFGLSDFASVHRVSEIRPELLHIELNYAAAYLLVRGEADADFSVLEFRMADDVLDSVHYFGNARLVIGPKQRGAVSGDQGFSFVV